jgi:hypothetical protein
MGKGSGRRPTAHDKPNAYQDNWELAFGKKKDTKQITKVIIEFEMPGHPSIDEMRNYVEKLHKEDKLVFLTTTTNA